MIKEKNSFFHKCEINFGQNLTKIQLGPKYTFASPPNFKWGYGPLPPPPFLHRWGRLSGVNFLVVKS